MLWTDKFKAEWGQKVPPLNLNLHNVLKTLEANVEDEEATMALVNGADSFLRAENKVPEMEWIFTKVKAVYAKTGLATRKLFSTISVNLYRLAAETVRATEIVKKALILFE